MTTPTQHPMIATATRSLLWSNTRAAPTAGNPFLSISSRAGNAKPVRAAISYDILADMPAWMSISVGLGFLILDMVRTGVLSLGDGNAQFQGTL